ncbi:hypothetical protein Cgig2_018849 [Carnegiea gigantea]|uniref:non-specific serine/threonine protein kinase n=1 Tax=Carnegiea gigantea TaxID=171969 RepID=A0A9Q1JLX5_9CARY|nr:hypothetical protein Cgig2_018849 [Carnegiea gigantea]
MKKNNKKKNQVKFEIKEEYFIRNGGILLQKQIALSQGQDIGSRQLKIFSIADIERATNCFDPDLVIGQIRFTVYKGFVDERMVVIKAPVDLVPSPELLDLFFTEASTGMVMNHNNMVKLYGCCLDPCLPILVYDFVPNGGLFQWLHGGIALNKSLKWVHRLRVATDVAYALSYMHNALSKPVVHRDVQSLNILLDKSFHAKLSNFGFSVSITPGEKPQRWPVIGAPGYIDPEYVETQEVTDKCDVYSFGVLMLELLTGRHPTVMAVDGVDLVDAVLSAVGRNCVMDMIDKKILEQGSRDEIQKFTQLALKCVAKVGMERPTMAEVVSELWLIQEEGLKFEAKEEYFIRNGGILLEKQIALSRGQDSGSRQLKVFSIKDIEKATNCFDPDLILGAVVGNVYQGILKELHVAIRVPLNLKPKPELIHIFLTVASTRVVMNHNSMVKLYGCCLETCIPIPVYEFFPNRTLFKHLHVSAAFTRRLKGVDRLKVAPDVSYALSYMHNALSKPVCPLLQGRHPEDGQFEELPDTLILNTKTLEVTDKCDVYSFGVLMWELLTGRQRNMLARAGIDLVDFIMEMIDIEASDQESMDEIEQFAQLASKCVAKKGKERPNMIQVVCELWLIQAR